MKHNGVNGTLNELRSRFWICNWRRNVKRIISRCFVCKRYQAKTAHGPPSHNLPKSRLSNDYAFSSTGIDFAGPLFVKPIFDTKFGMLKAYILSFTYATTRNKHLELTPGKDSGSLIRGLKRF